MKEEIRMQEFSRQITAQQSRAETLDRGCYFFFKRVFDVAVSMAAGTVLLLPMAVIAFLIRLDSPGPVIYRQERLGVGGVPFTLYKFRSMRLDAEKDGPQWAENQDPRCTRLGRFLRKYRLDELPQLWNIFIGDMSLVGPRPERRWFYQEFERSIPEFRARLRVKPGLTGLAQVSGGYELTPEEKLAYDLKYMESMSIKLDLFCLLRTAAVVFSGEGAR